MVPSLSEMNKEQLQQEIKKGIDDVENDCVTDFAIIKEAFGYLVDGDMYLADNDYKNAEKSYIKSIIAVNHRKFAVYGYYKLGLLYYKFQKPEILYSKFHFELALDYGMKEAAYYLATIYEWEKAVDNIEHSPETINSLYRIAAEESIDVKVKKLAIEKFKN